MPKKSLIFARIRSVILLTIGSVLIALGFALFQLPHNIAAGGVSGLAIIINHFTGWPVGTQYLIMNLPLMVLGWFYLGRWGFVVRTLASVAIFSVATDVFTVNMPTWLENWPVSDDILLCSLYAGMIAGVGNGLVYHGRGTIGGTAIVGRIIQLKTGMPLSNLYLYTDGLVVVGAGAIFGWEVALYAMLTLMLSGVAADYTLEGPSSIRVAHIITRKPDAVAKVLMSDLMRGVSKWEIQGGYTGETRHMLMCTISRPQVADLKRVVVDCDPDAFITIASGHQAVGEGFIRPKPVKG